jgi:hypothetical protein
VKSQLSLSVCHLSVYRFQKEKNDCWKLWAEKVRTDISYKHGNLTDRLKKKVNDVLIDTNRLNTLVDKGDNKVGSFNLIKYDLAAAHLDTRYCCFTDGMSTSVTAMDENGYKLRMVWQPCVFTSWTKTDMVLEPTTGRGRKLIWFWNLRMAVDENWYSFGAYDWPWTKSDVVLEPTTGRGRKLIWFWSLRLAVDENWYGFGDYDWPWTKTDMVLGPTTGRGQKLIPPNNHVSSGWNVVIFQLSGTARKFVEVALRKTQKWRRWSVYRQKWQSTAECLRIHRN